MGQGVRGIHAIIVEANMTLIRLAETMEFRALGYIHWLGGKDLSVAALSWVMDPAALHAKVNSLGCASRARASATAVATAATGTDLSLRLKRL